MGDPNDATSLENMRATLQYIKKCNEIRRQNGLGELQVNAELMAIAQAQLNASLAQGGGHTGIYKVGENLAYGSYVDPFDSWYTQEKKVYDYLQTHGLTMDEVNANPALKQQIADELSLPSAGWVQTGHYENITNSNYIGTGFAILKHNNANYRWYGQVFEVRGSHDYTDGLMDVDTFFAAFDEYYSNLMGAQGRYEEAQAQLDALKAELEGKISDLEKANADLTTAKGNYTQAQNGVTEAENAVTENETAQKELQDKLDSILNGEANAALKAELENFKVKRQISNLKLQQQRRY